mmetsp:Transcript_15970/g.22823  ORF Transcript_15970/g.22823 Transcript_15970/m.22823 type:complete len:238 (-) Transcript_15970:494-1207(-)
MAFFCFFLGFLLGICEGFILGIFEGFLLGIDGGFLLGNICLLLLFFILLHPPFLLLEFGIPPLPTLCNGFLLGMFEGLLEGFLLRDFFLVFASLKTPTLVLESRIPLWSTPGDARREPSSLIRLLVADLRAMEPLPALSINAVVPSALPIWVKGMESNPSFGAIPLLPSTVEETGPPSTENTVVVTSTPSTEATIVERGARSTEETVVVTSIPTTEATVVFTLTPSIFKTVEMLSGT